MFGAGIEPATHRLLVCCSTQLSYPVVDEPESNRRSSAFTPLLYPTRATVLAKHLLPRFGIRHGNAARTGRHRKPYRCNVFDRCSVLPAVANRQSLQAHSALYVANPASRRSRRSITTRRTCAGRSRALASGAQHRAPGCFRAKNDFHRLVLPNSRAACASFTNAGNKTPPGLATRGRSRCLGRSGRPISQGVRP